ncbi:glycosyltransferase family 1 protein [Pelagibacterium sp. H642]|uniref:glycosyltransferase family 4 protein n=1 Tax=Pelagibacterium sp. H642 TaxID=1881069 RepID=UPI002815BE0A|nr:glycosyltransferase family 1 protein [Pelagibacterium sp. H642]WMT89962.1 glycosyltransferase family 1 protein [Pelagibacterium sp. H642]
MVRLLIVSDAWHPQVNGVVRSLDTVGQTLAARGYEVLYLTPETFWTVPLPTYPEIRVSMPSLRGVQEFIDKFNPHHIHIATEGPLGLAARGYCVTRELAFTTSYHTRFPEYVAARLPVPVEWSYGYLRWFHAAASVTMVPTTSVLRDLRRKFFRHLAIWSRGVDLKAFSPGPKAKFAGLPGPHLLYVGRVAVEKNIEAFLELDHPGTKIVVGDGPQRAALADRHRDVVFTGKLTGSALRDAYRSADVLVFPSRTDTFGNVMLEAMACGTPVAAYPVMGPIDVLAREQGGALDEDLGAAVRRALAIPRSEALARARQFTWDAAADQFARRLAPVRRQIAHVA